MRFNAPYAAYARSLGFDALHPPQSWRELPAVPSLAFKESALVTFEPRDARIVFETSGTTQSESGRHYFESSSLALYDAALLAGFDRFMLADAPSALRYLLLAPNRSSSSLGYMLRRVAEARGDGKGGTFVDDGGDSLELDALERALAHARDEGAAVCIGGTAFAFLALIEMLGGRSLPALPGSRIMETGGYKGRSRTLERPELYARLAECFCIPEDRIVAEYGMTELTSQYYDSPASRARGERIKAGPPWLRPLIVDARGAEVGLGEIGALRHVDLANRASAIAIQTEDLALRLPGEEFVLLGRDADARLRGCSLDVEDLLARRG